MLLPGNSLQGHVGAGNPSGVLSGLIFPASGMHLKFTPSCLFWGLYSRYLLPFRSSTASTQSCGSPYVWTSLCISMFQDGARDRYVGRTSVWDKSFRSHGPPDNVFQDGHVVRVTKLFCPRCPPQQPQNESVTNPGRTRDSRLQAWKLSVRTTLKGSVIRAVSCDVVLQEPFQVSFLHCFDRAIPGEPQRSQASFGEKWLRKFS